MFLYYFVFHRYLNWAAAEMENKPLGRGGLVGLVSLQMADPLGMKFFTLGPNLRTLNEICDHLFFIDQIQSFLTFMKIERDSRNIEEFDYQKNINCISLTIYIQTHTHTNQLLCFAVNLALGEGCVMDAQQANQIFRIAYAFNVKIAFISLPRSCI